MHSLLSPLRKARLQLRCCRRRYIGPSGCARAKYITLDRLDGIGRDQRFVWAHVVREDLCCRDEHFRVLHGRFVDGTGRHFLLRGWLRWSRGTEGCCSRALRLRCGNRLCNVARRGRWHNTVDAIRLSRVDIPWLVVCSRLGRLRRSRRDECFRSSFACFGFPFALRRSALSFLFSFNLIECLADVGRVIIGVFLLLRSDHLPFLCETYLAGTHVDEIVEIFLSLIAHRCG